MKGGPYILLAIYGYFSIVFFDDTSAYREP